MLVYTPCTAAVCPDAGVLQDKNDQQHRAGLGAAVGELHGDVLQV